MSATNRGSKRIESDFYPTPTETIDIFLKHYEIGKELTILEPCAGNGNIVESLKKIGCKNIDAVEIRREELENLVDKVGIGHVAICDFLTMNNKFLLDKYDIIITNPPYNLAQEFVEKSLEVIKPGGTVIMLLRTNFLESKKRFSFWQKNKLNGLYVLSKRPSFTGKGTDATSYSWFIWTKNEKKQTIEVI